MQHGTCAASIGNLKQRIRECIQGTSRETPHPAMEFLPSRLQDCVERRDGNAESAMLTE